MLTCALVKEGAHQNSSIPQKSAGHAQQLPLSRAEVATTLCQL